MVCKWIYERVEAGQDTSGAAHDSYAQLVDEMALAANEDRVMEFIGELPPSVRKEVRRGWLELVRNAASNEERERD